LSDLCVFLHELAGTKYLRTASGCQAARRSGR
jgi:hypothetical protein